MGTSKESKYYSKQINKSEVAENQEAQEAIKFGLWILKEIQDNDDFRSTKWDFNGELITTKELYKRFKKRQRTK